MGFINKILVATDGSETAFKAARHAGDLARAVGAKVTVIMVQDEQLVMPEAWAAAGLVLTGGVASPSIEDIRHKFDEQALSGALAETAKALGDTPSKPELISAWGHPSETICDIAAEKSIDLIVVGSHGRSGLKRALLGSVSHSVSNHAPCAVTIVR